MNERLFEAVNPWDYPSLAYNRIAPGVGALDLGGASVSQVTQDRAPAGVSPMGQPSTSTHRVSTGKRKHPAGTGTGEPSGDRKPETEEQEARRRKTDSHCAAEKRRRERINAKLLELQSLVPNSSSTEKAAILEDAIEYIKSMQAQLQFMCLFACRS